MADLISDYARPASRDEWRFLTQCIATQCVHGGDVVPAELDVAGLDWKIILRLAEIHCVVPLLSAAVIAGKVRNVTPEAVADLRNRFHDSAQRGMSFVMELRGLLAGLRKAGIRCIPLKGPVLMLGSYRKMGLRYFDDLDLLVAPADVAGAVAALAELGYGGWDISQHLVAWHLDTESEYQLNCEDRGFVVDLHWALGRKYFTMPMDFDQLWNRTVRTKLIGTPVPDLSPEDLVLYLCYHGGRHLFGRLSWVCDVAATVTAHPDLDWDALMAKATQMGARRLTLLGLCLARGILGCSLPASVESAIQNESALPPLVATVSRGMFRDGDSPSSLGQQVEASLFHLRVRERNADRLRYLFWAAAPNMRDWNHSRLPRSLSFLLVLSRPVRLLRKHLASRK